VAVAADPEVAAAADPVEAEVEVVVVVEPLVV
jgi:hypothetical protein